MNKGSTASLLASKVEKILEQTLWNVNCAFRFMIRSLPLESAEEKEGELRGKRKKECR
jgi:hypothetical protein